MSTRLSASEARRARILDVLKQAELPIPGKELGELTGVSRQIVVGDINLLKAVNEPILSTSRGYVYMAEKESPEMIQRIAVCQHTASQAEEELTIFADHGITVKDVRIEHPLYGDLAASIMVSNRMEVKDFIKKAEAANAVYLSALTENYTHLHTLLANNEKQLEQAFEALRKAGILVE